MKLMRRTLSFALCCLIGLFAALASDARAQNVAPRVAALEHALFNDKVVRGFLGLSFDVVRVEPVVDQPGEFVVDAATSNRSTGIRALVDLKSESVSRVKKLDPPDILFGPTDVATAFGLVRNSPALRARLGATLPLYRTTTDESARYRVEGLPVRGTLPSDPCTTHRCLQLLFHGPHGYVPGLPLLVDLTAGAALGTGARSIAPQPPAQTRAPGVTVLATALSGLELPECHAEKFSSATSSWTICWYYVSGVGLVVGPVTYKKPNGVSFGVIDNARVGEIFVPYASGFPRFFDTSFGFPNAPLTANLCLRGTLFDGGTACIEHRDRDVDWMFPAGTVPTGRRGEEIVLWSVLYAANYLYIEEWGFRDDGAVWGRVGATGQNLPGSETESHAHDYFWRIVPHIAGRGNSLNYVGVSEPVSGLSATDVTMNIPQPTPVVWNPQRFDQLEVYAPGVTNGRGDIESYRLMAMPFAGLAHHNEFFSRADLWATSGDPTETDASQLPKYASEHVSLVNTKVGMWYRGSFHHEPRDEDGFYDSNGNFIGTTHAFWVGFMLFPRNLFDRSPFF